MFAAAMQQHARNKCKLAAGWQKGPYDKTWKFESDAYFKTFVHVEPLLKISMVCHEKSRNYMLSKWYSASSLRTSFQNVMKHHDVI